MLVLSLGILVLIGHAATGSFDFLIKDVWFTSGILLVILISLIDQPHFSKDGNVFLNSITALTTLMLIDTSSRSVFWFTMLGFSGYLLTSSYALMWIRKVDSNVDNKAIKFFSKLNREVGKPTVLFSAFFAWGVIEKFGINSVGGSALFVFWSLFIILSIPNISAMICELFDKNSKDECEHPELISITNPLGAFVRIPSSTITKIGSSASICDKAGACIAEGVLIDDRIVANTRIGKVKIKKVFTKESDFSDEAKYPITVRLSDIQNDEEIVSVVDVGTSIGKVQFYINPNIQLEGGELVWVNVRDRQRAYFQVVYEEVIEESVEEHNEVQYVKIIAGQLGEWSQTNSRFEQLKLVASPGELIHRVLGDEGAAAIPSGSVNIGIIPNSKFPIHINLNDAVTHNTAILGVTGSGKSYIAFKLIESLIAADIKVLILDPSRQHYTYLKSYDPYTLKTQADIGQWLNQTKQKIGIHQFGIDGSMPKITSEFVVALFNSISGSTTLKAGVNERAKVCIIFEEAHSLIPEWNQAEKGDVEHINKTARVILQGRKYGLGSIIITQRTANVTKTMLNQCNTIIALQSFDQTGLDFLRNYMGEEYAQAISTMPIRHGVLVGKASSSSRPVIFKIDELKYGDEKDNTMV